MTTASTPAQAAPPSTPEAIQQLFNDTQERLKACSADRQVLQEKLEAILTELWTEALNAVEIALPDFKVEGSVDNRMHSLVRGRILTAGNKLKRSLPNILKNFETNELLTSQVVTKVTMPGRGVFNLPPNVRMPSERGERE